ncbi:MAG: alanine--tRNA ligase, partial [Gemmatales bacterium]|nr:alanine--tRNA ligase [Gemmatales bacterium]MDW8388028.1 alanine--tRNA ligase [Gemmatales bacterium]
MRGANATRQEFIDFFVHKHGHTMVPSSSVVPLDDPTLMFTNAGMNQFKDVFLGTGTRPYKRAVNSQKCIRVSGKHNDLEEVGRDTYHHTFFEMLGNWSFGDYYKAEAIQWAWDLLTREWGIDKSRLHATVFGGDPQLGLEPDDEAFRLWTQVTDIAPDHVHRFGTKDNFWMMGETGPCGPCSEIHIDRTPDKSGGRLINKGDARVMEIWNLVFIQYNRDEQGRLTLLPAKHVDTGMGFERICAVLQGKESNYDTDVFSPLMDAIADLVGKRYGGRLDDLTDVAFRVVADHLRMLTFAITDGAMPGNKGRGSVLRSVLRRAVRFGWQCFAQREPFLFKLVPALVEHMGGAFPELRRNPARVADIIRSEEADFLRTIERGLALFEQAAERAGKDGVISGDDVFELHTTYGFPPDLTQQMARERGLRVDEAGYQQRMREHEEKSRGQAVVSQIALASSVPLPETDDRPKWAGRTGTGRILGWIRDNAFVTQGRLAADDQPETGVGLVLDRTCFYAEQGGQVGDRGVINTDTGSFVVEQTIKIGNATVHVGKVTRGFVEIGQTARLEVDAERELTRKNHTATHLLHWALCKVLGDHVEQRGSKVKPDGFTFDFSHPKPLSEAEKAEVERLVNEKIYADLPVSAVEMPQSEARKLPGIKAFFGDKYGDVVRVISIGDGFSREFCGGTHLDHTGQAGFFKIVGEEAVGKGVRRLVCVTGPEAVKHIQHLDHIVHDLTDRFRCKPEEVPQRVEALQEEIRKLQQQLRKGAATDLTAAADRLLSQAVEVNGVKLVAGEMPSAPEEQLRQQMDRLRQKLGSGVIVFGWVTEGKVGLMAAVTEDLVKRGLHAGKLVGELAKLVGGAGGGKPTLAQAGGKDPARLSDAL